MPQRSWSSKLAGTTIVTIVAGGWYLAIAPVWETVSLTCQPSPEQVICKISGEPYPGITRNIAILKNQLSGIKPTFRSIEGNLVQHIVLTTIDQQEIPLNIHPSGHLTVQLFQQKNKIAAFLANPQAQTLAITTQRNFPLPLSVITAVIMGMSGFYLKKLWIDSK
jgi:hypothetical protein